MLNPLTRITDYLTTQSWQIAVLFFVVAGLTWLLRKRTAHLRYLLWCIILIKCFTPSLMQVPLAFLPSHEPIPAVQPQPWISRIAPAETPAFKAIEPTTDRQPPPGIARPTTIRPQLRRTDIKQLLANIWMTGVAVFLLIALIKAIRVNRWLRKSRTLLDSDDSASPANVYLVEGTSQPFVWGLLKGAVYVPADFAKNTHAEHQRKILAHEFSHVVRFDAAVNLLQIIAQALFWFHPLIWWTNRQIRQEREKCCDEMAIARLSASPRDYSTAIVDVLVNEYQSQKPVPSLAIAGPIKNIEDRIKTIMTTDRKFHRRPTILSITIVLLLALITIPTTLALTRKPTPSPTPEPERTPKLSQFKTTLPNGVAVELVGVCGHPSSDKRWWRPDGSPLKVSPYASIGAKVSDGQPREFAVQLTNLPGEKISYRWSFTPSASSAGGHHPDDKSGKQIKDIWAIAAGIREGIEAVTIKFGVSAGKWQTQAIFDGKGHLSIGQGDYAFSFAKPYLENNHTYVTVSDNMLKFPHRLIAVDKDGRIHKSVDTSSGTAGEIRQSTFGFKNLPIENIQEFQFQTRPYEWVQFKNVSLKPNVKTDVQIEVEKPATEDAENIPERKKKYVSLIAPAIGQLFFDGAKVENIEKLAAAFKQLPAPEQTVIQVVVSAEIRKEDGWKLLEDMLHALTNQYKLAGWEYIGSANNGVGHRTPVDGEGTASLDVKVALKVRGQEVDVACRVRILKPDKKEIRRIKSSDDSVYRFAGLAGGEYIIEAYFWDSYPTRYEKITLSEGKHTQSSYTFQTEQVARIPLAGKIIDSITNKGIGRAKLHFVGAPGDDIITNADGSFSGMADRARLHQCLLYLDKRPPITVRINNHIDEQTAKKLTIHIDRTNSKARLILTDMQAQAHTPQELQKPKEFYLPDLDKDQKMLDILSGALISLKENTSRNAKHRTFLNSQPGKGDLIYDFDGRTATLASAQGSSGFNRNGKAYEFVTYNPVKTFSPSELPLEFDLIIRARNYTIKVLRADENGCHLDYYPATDSKTNVQTKVEKTNKEVVSANATPDPAKASAMLDVLKGMYGTVMQSLADNDANSALAALETMMPQVDAFEKNLHGTDAQTSIVIGINQLQSAYNLLKQGKLEKAKAVFRTLNSAGPGYEKMVRTEAKKVSKKNSKPSQFKTTLANGVMVELVGICDHPSKGKQWWQPDSSLLESSPYDDDFGKAFPKDGEKGYKFAVKYSGMAGKDVDARIIPSNFKSTNGGALFSTSEKNGKENTKYVDGSLDEKIVWLGAAFDEELSSCDIKIGVCWGDWKRNYRHETDRPNDAVEWVEFKNVSLKPNLEPDVQPTD